MRFFAVSKNLQTDFSRLKRQENEIKTYTSPLLLEDWFFNCFRKFGKITFLDKESVKKERNLAALKSPDAIFLSLHGRKNSLPGLDDIPLRTLRLAHSSFLIPDSLFSLDDFSAAQVNLVSTSFEKERLYSCLGKAAPNLSVFTPRVEADFFHPPDKKQRLLARKKLGLNNGCIHIIYAGRWIANKGIPQLIRTLSLWPLSGTVVTFVGNFEREFLLHHALGNHSTFPLFLEYECLSHAHKSRFRFESARDNFSLRELFWSADLFVNPSINADENFGITPREAALCGVPVVTTNFCGLRPLADNLPWGGVDTYPTLYGLRFSLRQLRRLIGEALSRSPLYSPQEYRKAVLKECNPRKSLDELAKAIDFVKRVPVKSAKDINRMRHNIKRRIFQEASEKIVKSLITPFKDIPAGCFMYGSGPTHPAFKTMQGVFSICENAPRVTKGSIWRGFSRISLCKEEKAVVDFSFPGPRMRYYRQSRWRNLLGCCHQTPASDWVFIPSNKEQIRMIEELVEYGYLVPDE